MNLKNLAMWAIIVFLTIGIVAVQRFQKKTSTYDHSYIIIDEVIGQLLTLYISFKCGMG